MVALVALLHRTRSSSDVFVALFTSWRLLGDAHANVSALPSMRVSHLEIMHSFECLKKAQATWHQKSHVVHAVRDLRDLHENEFDILHYL